MRKILLALIFAAPSFGFAQAGANHVRGILGFDRSALNLGADYENLVGNIGFGGYFLLSAENKDAGKNQVMALGANMPLHLMNDSQFDVYMAPGFGLAMVKGLTGQDDKTTFGPSIKTGFEHKFSSTVKAGLQHVYLVNWFDNKSAAGWQFVNATATFAF